MKKFVIFLLIIMLCGCSVDENSVFIRLDDVFTTYVKDENPKHNNNNTYYYNFYLPSDMQEIEYDNIFHHLKFNNSDFVMNLNVNDILSSNFFEEKVDEPYVFLNSYSFYSNNIYTDDNDAVIFNMYYYNNNYLFSLYSSKLSFFGKTTLSDAPELVKHLFMINDSIVIDEKKVVSDYYSGSIIDFTKESVNLFDTYHSVDGYVSDLLID